MNKKIFLSTLVLTLTFSGVAYAHNPRVVEAGAVTNIENPEISQAFYGTLSGKPQAYFIKLSEPFKLYAGLLVPDVSGATKDFSAEIIQIGKFIDDTGQDASTDQATTFGGKKTTLFKLDGTQMDWKRFYEEFGNDWYWQGPETALMDAAVTPSPAGLYEIKVSNPSNQGKYVLVVGTKEKWPPGEIWNTLLTMPHVKTFFGESPFTSFSNRIGLFIFGPILGLAAFVPLAILLIKRQRGKKRK